MVILALAVLLASSLLTENERAKLYERKERAALRLVDQLALALLAPLEFNDPVAVQEAVARLAADPEIVSLRVRDAEPEGPSVVFGEVPEAAIGVRQVAWDEDVMWVVRPVGDASGTYGSVVLGLSLARERALVAEQRTHVLVGGLLLSMAVAVLLLGAARRMVVRPLARLGEVVETFGRGERVEPPQPGPDEVGRLAGAFAGMMTAIAERERKLAEANAEVERLLDAMRQAVFSFDRRFQVVGRSSSSAGAMFGRASLTGEDVRVLLTTGLPEGNPEISAVVSFVETVFEVPASVWSQVAQLAPRELCLFPETPQARELVLEFVPLLEGDEITRIMVVVSDETEARRMVREVAELRDRHAAELVATRRILGLGGRVFVEFVETTATRLRSVEMLLDAPSRERFDEVLRQVHATRGDARALGLVELAETLTRAEAELAEVRNSCDPPPRERWTAALREHLVRAHDDLQRARARLVAASPLGEEALDELTVSARDLDELSAAATGASPAVRRCVDRLRGRRLRGLLLGLPDAVGAWAAEEGKRVQLEISGAGVRVPATVAEPLRTAIVQLVRNAVAHGVESPAVRRDAGKPCVGRITIRAEDEGAGAVVVVEDDGAGIDFAALARRAGQAAECVLSEELPFVSGLSTRERANGVAGRGVGLCAVREALATCDYVVTVRSEPGRGASFTLAPRVRPADRLGGSR